MAHVGPALEVCDGCGPCYQSGNSHVGTASPSLLNQSTGRNEDFQCMAPTYLLTVTVYIQKKKTDLNLGLRNVHLMSDYPHSFLQKINIRTNTKSYVKTMQSRPDLLLVQELLNALNWECFSICTCKCQGKTKKRISE